MINVIPTKNTFLNTECKVGVLLKVINKFVNINPKYDKLKDIFSDEFPKLRKKFTPR